MPVLRFKTYRLLSLVDPSLSLGELVGLLERVKAEIEEAGEDFIEVELEVDRPDMYIAEGIARYLRGVLGIEKGAPRYRVVDSGYVIEVGDVPARPYIGGLVAWRVNVDADYLEELIQLQEKLHNSLGGRRRRVAIGIHDLSKLPSKRLRYVFEEIGEVEFQPLGAGSAMKLSEILASTEQGRKYGSISLMKGRHPVLYSGDAVISAPPVINAELTRIEPGTRDVFVDVTGTDLRGVLDVLAVLAASLADRGDGRVGLVSVRFRDGRELKTPDLEPRGFRVNITDVSRLIGIDVSVDDALEALQRARMDAGLAEPGVLEVRVPRYRVDVLHWVDLAEEVMIIQGIDKVPLRRPRSLLRPLEQPTRTWERFVRLILTGYGFTELLTFTLVKCSLVVEVTGQEPLRLRNPVSEEHSCIRPSLLPALLEAASHANRPGLRVFELGGVFTPPLGEERLRLGMLVMDEKAGYEDIQSYVYGLLDTLSDRVTAIKPCTKRPFIEGRTACLETAQGITGVVGEVDPGLLEKLGITYPVAAAELDYTGLSVRGPAVPRP